MKNSYDNRYSEILGILFFQLSNNISPFDGHITANAWVPVLRLLKMSNVMKTSLKLHNTRDTTILATAERLFQIAFEVMDSLDWGDFPHLCKLYPVKAETLALIEWLLDSGQDPNIPLLHYGESSLALHIALRDGFLDIVIMCLDKGADPNIVVDFFSKHTLSLAIEELVIKVFDHSPRYDIIGKLLDAGADPNSGSSFLTAVRSGDMRIIKMLVEHGAEIANLSVKLELEPDIPGFRKLEAFSISKRDVLAYAADVSTEVVSLHIVQFLLGVMQQQNGSSQLAHLVTPDSLLGAAGNGYNDVLALLLDQDISINATTSEGFSALHTAAYGGHIETCEILLLRGASVEPLTDISDTPSPLHIAAACNNIHVVMLLHKWGGHIDKPTNLHRSMLGRWGESPIAAAMRMNFEEMATFNYLFLQGAAIPKDALHYAASKTDLELVSLLLQNTGDPNSRSDSGETPLQAALKRQSRMLRFECDEVRNKCIKIASLLLDYGAVIVGGEAVEAIKLADWELVERILRQDINIATTHPYSTMLHEALFEGTPEIIQKVLIFSPGAYDSDSLLAVARLPNATVGISVATQLLENRPTHKPIDTTELRAIQMATRNDKISLLGLLLEKLPESYTAVMNTKVENSSPLLDTRDSPLARALLLNHGYRPNGAVIAQAAREGDLTMLKELWPHYQRCSNSQLVTHGPLHAAIERRNIDLVSFFLDEGEDVNDNEEHVFFGRTPLQAAAEEGDLTIFDFILQRGANINAVAAHCGGATALQAACIAGYIGIAKTLIDLGADINAPRARKFGRTALEGAAEHGRIDILHLLLDQGVNTTGYGRLQYARSIAFAERERHPIAVRLLKSHRKWAEQDEILLLRVERHFDERCELCQLCEIREDFDTIDISFGENPGTTGVDIDWDTEFSDFYSQNNERCANCDGELDEDVYSDSDIEVAEQIGVSLDDRGDDERPQEVALES